MTKRIVTDALGPLMERKAAEIPSDRQVRFYFDEDEWVEVSFNGEVLELSGSRSLAIAPRSSNVAHVWIRGRQP